MPVFPFIKFKNADISLGPEMKSTGESMNIDEKFEAAFAKAFISTNQILPTKGNVLISVRDGDKTNALIDISKDLISSGFKIYATNRTAKFLKQNGIECEKVNKINESRPNIVDLIINNEIVLYINTSDNFQAIREGVEIRRQAVMRAIPCIRNLKYAFYLTKAIIYYKNNEINVDNLQSF
jgi:carbamoyl-phosphate synthase large subunit